MVISSVKLIDFNQQVIQCIQFDTRLMTTFYIFFSIYNNNYNHNVATIV